MKLGEGLSVVLPARRRVVCVGIAMNYGMSRRNFLFGATLAGFALGTAGLAPPIAMAAEDAVDYVRGMYQRAAGRTPALPKRELANLLSGDLRRLWQVQAQPPQSDTEFVRAVMFGPNLQPTVELAVRSVADIPGLPRERIVAVDFTSGKDAHQVFVHLAPVDKGGWVIVNFIYDVGEDFRRTTERRLRTAG